ncbi:HAMP domain-containing methyl-accepting chemotaxis protein [Fluviispira multicolorata]|uniref:Methyl-accepting transducer domain-containing protein n=1 Tax=Fluviispira multicolorata TaxID=2654512 RepID=A0A833JF72_9BACT|nr:methyl-accepting chemotaxis protein [Fluviispira multicolorata]KAB8033570.1 hypothetical protein GCL57_02355 [Fluviispira multicolorata]
MINGLSLKAKLVNSYIFCAICILATSLSAYIGLKQTIETFTHVSEVNLENMVALGKMQTAQRDIIIAVSLLLGSHSTLSEVTLSKNIATKAENEFEKAAKIYEGIPFVAGEEEQWNDAKKNWKPFMELSYKLISLSFPISKENEALRDHLGAKEFVQLKEDLILKIEKIYNFQLIEKNKWTSLAQNIGALSVLRTLIIVLIGVIISILFGVIISHYLSKLLKNITNKLTEVSNSVASASKQISSSSHKLSSAIQEQASSIQETSASIEEMSAMTQQNAQNATQSQIITAKSQKTVESGRNAIKEMLNAMDDIDASNNEIIKKIEDSNKNISEIIKVISEIGNKTKVINEIVFQTKLLSFNASVEAARAGEHGKGFAVVAEEVGNLAQVSGNASKEITSLLKESTKKVEEIVENTKSQVSRFVEIGKEKVHRGSEVAQSCNIAFEDIAQSINEVSAMMKEISVASNEQASGAEQINHAIRQLDQATQLNATACNETAHIAEQLSSQVENLGAVVNELTDTVNGTKRIESDDQENRYLINT